MAPASTSPRLDIFWLKDESLEDSANLPKPHVLAADIVEDLRTALEQFEAIQADLSRPVASVAKQDKPRTRGGTSARRAPASRARRCSLTGCHARSVPR